MRAILMEKFYSFRVPLFLARKAVLSKKLITIFIILLTVGMGAGGVTGTHAVAAPFILLLESDADPAGGAGNFYIVL